MAIVVLVVLAGGCGGRGDPAPMPVHGVLTVKGQPADGATVVFHPKAGKGPKASGKTDAKGEFRLTTMRAGDGVVSGEYVVTIIWPDSKRLLTDGTDDGTDRLGGKYRDPAKPLTIVTINPDQTDPIVLTVK